MKLNEGDFVQYRKHKGVVDFICEHYCVLQLPPNENRSAPRLLVFREFQEEINVLEAKAVTIKQLQIIS
jgi:hypothetical protein